jgi:RHS repeat-associated protein
LDRQTFVGFGTTGAPPSYASTIETTYDAGDRATEIVDSVAGTIERTYDLLDRLTEEVTPEGTVSYTYDDAGRRESMTVAGQTAVSYTYDNADRLTGVTRGTAAVTIGYDNADRRTSLTLPNGIVVEYGYDDDSRLTGLTYKQGMSTLGTLTYGYDANGQRTSVGGSYARTGLPAALGSASYDDANQIASFGGTSLTYDDNGNLTSDGVRAYTWNARNELASLTGPVSGSFAYDAFGRRRSKTIGGTTTQFLYDGLNPVQELSGGSPTANLLTGLGIDEYFTRTDASGVRNFLTDALGSTVALADGSGTVQTEYSYEPFGGTTTSGGSTSNAFAFTGREANGTGLYYYRARYYDPVSGRFTAGDPIGCLGGVNVYAYVGDSPTGFVDPLGTQALPAPAPPPVPAPIVIPPWAYFLVFDVWILEHDWREFQRLCLASGWDWCSPNSSSSSSSSSPHSSPKPNNNAGRKDDDPDKTTCRKLLDKCLEESWSRDCGACYRECMLDDGAWPFYKCSPRK